MSNIANVDRNFNGSNLREMENLTPDFCLSSSFLFVVYSIYGKQITSNKNSSKQTADCQKLFTEAKRVLRTYERLLLGSCALFHTPCLVMAYLPGVSDY